MALDMDKEFDRHQKGWESFAKISIIKHNCCADYCWTHGANVSLT